MCAFFLNYFKIISTCQQIKKNAAVVFVLFLHLNAVGTYELHRETQQSHQE